MPHGGSHEIASIGPRRGDIPADRIRAHWIYDRVCTMTVRKIIIITKYDPPPIPWREADWSAVFDDYDLGGPIGHGPTEQDAIDDLLMEAAE